MDENYQKDLKSNNLSLNEAIDVAQNHPLWRLMSVWHYALLVVHVRNDDVWIKCDSSTASQLAVVLCTSYVNDLPATRLLLLTPTGFWYIQDTMCLWSTSNYAVCVCKNVPKHFGPVVDKGLGLGIYREELVSPRMPKEKWYLWVDQSRPLPTNLTQWVYSW